MDIDKIEELLTEYYKKYPLAIEGGSEFVMQNDEAQSDALELICKIFDTLVP